MRNDFGACNFIKQFENAGMLHTTRDGGHGQNLGGNRNDLMTAVQNTDFHSFKVMHIVCKCGAGGIPIGATCTKIILDHPLAEIFMGHGASIVNAQIAHQFQFSWSSCGYNAINHRIWERTLRIDPISQVSILQTGQSHNSLAQNIAIALQIVATQSGKGAKTCIPAQTQCGNNGTKCGFWGIRIFTIMNDVSMRSIQPIGHGIQIITALGHSKSYDANIGLCHTLDQGAISLLNGQIIDH